MFIEQPSLVKGIYDFFRNDPLISAIPVIGPSRDAAQLEGSKDFAKRFMQRHGIPTAAYRTFTAETLEDGLAFLETLKAPYVLKADGLCAGKGVLILPTLDEGNDWETLRRQIAGGLNLMATGQPWWTYDAGGFFRPGNQYTDAGYQERMMRWIQTAVFLPFMRVHGYMSRTEPWNYSAETQENFHKQIELRDRLQPYILDCARKVSSENYTMMRPLVFDFPGDTEALKQQTEFMFGPSLLVCPVTESGIRSMRVYLPRYEAGWKLFDSTDSRIYKGGEYVDVPVTIDRIPVFVKSDHKINLK